MTVLTTKQQIEAIKALPQHKALVCDISLAGLIRQMTSKYGYILGNHKLAEQYSIYMVKAYHYICRDTSSPFYNKSVNTK